MPSDPQEIRTVKVRQGDRGLTAAAVVAAVCMGGSLYFSEVANFPPCKLCWYQRYAMYPLVPILGVAAWRGFTRIRPYAFALAAIGSMVSTYHILVERGAGRARSSRAGGSAPG